MPFEDYEQIPKHRYDIIIDRYNKFIKNLDNPEENVISVFDPLNPKQLQELELIRDVSQYLQKKKDDDIRKAAQAKVEEEEKSAAEEKVEAEGDEKKEE